MRSLPAFLAVALAVTLTPGPGRAALHGRRSALANIAGNSVGVLAWGVLSALGISALVAANALAYDVLRLTGAAFLLWLGVRALAGRTSLGRQAGAAPPGPSPSARRAARKGLVNSLANPKLAVFFVALFPQFLRPGAAVLPAALLMAAVIVAFDIVVYGSVALIVDRFRQALRPRLLRAVERTSGAILLVFGLRLAREAR
jgi:threonine/homoserine/homoserine lactone efflux protein